MSRVLRPSDDDALRAELRARGVTVIDNAAREPEIADLCSMLVDMGAQIAGIGSDRLEITGVAPRLGAESAALPSSLITPLPACSGAALTLRLLKG